jgi:hypothetical protein
MSLNSCKKFAQPIPEHYLVALRAKNASVASLLDVDLADPLLLANNLNLIP